MDGPRLWAWAAATAYTAQTASPRNDIAKGISASSAPPTRKQAGALHYGAPVLQRHTSRVELVGRVPATLDLVHHLAEVVALRRLHRRERLQRLEPLEPELLADRQHV